MSKVIGQRVDVKSWSKISKTDAPLIHDWLVDVGKRRGVDTYDDSQTRVIFEELEKDKSVLLRKYIEWNDTKAAFHWRLHQIRNLVGSIIIVVVYDDGHEESARAFQNTTIPVYENGEKVDDIPTYLPPKALAVHTELLDQVILYRTERLEHERDEIRKMNLDGVFGEVVIAIDNLVASVREATAKTVENIEEAIAKADPGAKKSNTYYRSAVLLVLASYIGTDSLRLSKYSGYNLAFVQRLKDRMVKANVWGTDTPNIGHVWGTDKVASDKFWKDVEIAEGIS